MSFPLDEMKILDFTYLLPGPFGTMILSDMGADIIKVENSANPDLARLLPPFVDDTSAFYSHINRGKKSLSLNLKQEEAREVIFKLVKDYDIIVEQFRPGVMDRLGIGYEKLKEVNSSIIYCSLTGYGQTGSYSDRAGHDINYMSLSGIESFSGKTESGPALSGIQVADIAGGSQSLVIGTLTAYINRLKSGKGDYIDISITDAAFAMSVFTTAGFLVDEVEPERERSMLNGGTLYDFYPTSDNRYLSAGPIEPKFFKAFCEIIDCPDLIENGIINVSAKKRIADIISKETLQFWHDRFRERDACIEPVYTLKEAVSNPPISEREMIVPVTSLKGNSIKQIGNPIKFRSGHYYAEKGGASLGYHNNEILSSIGYSESEVASLKESGAVGS